MDAGRKTVRRRLIRHLKRRIERRATLVISASPVLLKELTATGWLRDGPRRVVPYAIDAWKWDSATPASDTAPVVLAVGRLEGIKAPEVLVDAMAKVAVDVPDARLVLVGASRGGRDGVSYAEWIQRHADERGVALELVTH